MLVPVLKNNFYLKNNLGAIPNNFESEFDGKLVFISNSASHEGGPNGCFVFPESGNWLFYQISIGYAFHHVR